MNTLLKYLARTEQLIRVHGSMTALLLYHNAEPEAGISREQWQEAFDDLAEQARRLEAIIADEEAASKVPTFYRKG